jgi:hypothetical protein
MTLGSGIVRWIVGRPLQPATRYWCYVHPQNVISGISILSLAVWLYVIIQWRWRRTAQNSARMCRCSYRVLAFWHRIIIFTGHGGRCMLSSFSCLRAWYHRGHKHLGERRERHRRGVNARRAAVAWRQRGRWR